MMAGAAAVPSLWASERNGDKKEDVEIYLSVDDGWHYKRTIIDMANHHKVPLNLFIIGKVVELEPQFWAKAIEDGHEFGSHTYNHHHFSKVSAEVAAEDFKQYKKTITNLLGKETYERIKTFRYPYADSGNRQNRDDIRKMVADYGWKTSWWDMDLSFHSANYGMRAFKNEYDQLSAFTKKIKEKNVLLFHFKDPDFKAIELVIEYGKRKNYKFCKISDKICKA